MGGRSNGCIICKARRVKCDEQVPTCRRCQKANVVCKGYTSPFTFIDERHRVQRSLAIAKTQEAQFCALQNTTRQKSHTGHFVRITAELPPVAFKDNIYVSYLVSKLFEGRCPFGRNTVGNTGLVCGNSHGTWVNEIAEEPHMTALAAMTFGHAHYSSVIIRESRKSYGKALLNLRADLTKLSATTSFEIIASITALCMYEVSHCYLRLQT